jgi:NCAIR mutase (PurE)-related protein
MKKANWSYLAGFLDGDGSIYVQIKPNETYRFRFQIAPMVAFFQSKKEQRKIKELKNLFKIGYLRERNDGVIEWVIGREKEIKHILQKTLPFLRLKKKQAMLTLLILEKKKKMERKKDFIELIKLIDKFRNLNYSKRRKKIIY